MKSFIFALIKNNFYYVVCREDTELPEEVIQGLTAIKEGEKHCFIDYDPKDKIDSEQWFILKDFSKINGAQIELPEQTTSFSKVVPSRYKEIEFISSFIPTYRSLKKIFLLNRITPSLCIKGKSILNFETKTPTVTDNPKILLLKDIPDGIYVADLDVLIFKNIDPLKPIFSSLEKLYRAATRKEVKKIFNSPLIDLLISYEDMGISNLKRINGEFSRKIKDLTLSEIRKKNKDYDLGLHCENGKVRLSTANDVKNLLFILDERLYEGESSGQKRIATAIRPIKKTQKT